MSLEEGMVISTDSCLPLKDPNFMSPKAYSFSHEMEDGEFSRAKGEVGNSQSAKPVMVGCSPESRIYSLFGNPERFSVISTCQSVGCDYSHYLAVKLHIHI